MAVAASNSRLGLLPSLLRGASFLFCQRSRFSQSPCHRNLSISAASSAPSHHQGEDSAAAIVGKELPRRWKPLCLYHTQGKCALMTDSEHLGKFNHDILLDLQVNETKLDRLCSNDLDTLLILDLEGKVEIIEFPVLMIDVKSTNCIDLFHRFVRPVRMGEHEINEYIEGKYGSFGVERVWHDTAIPFAEVLLEFEAWLTNHHLLNKSNGSLHRAAFVTCGNWDVKTKIPQQCKDSHIKLPPYFMEWINLKDVYLNFYNQPATGMRSMLQQLGIPLVGSHHLGIDDTKNIVRVLQRMMLDGCPMVITARRKSVVGGHVEFLFENRIDGRRDGGRYGRR